MSLSNTKDSVCIIAEVGQNHQGQLELARKYIRTFAAIGADVVKFQVRDNKFLFSQDAYEAPYGSENAFAETYGAHREALELKPESIGILIKDCHDLGVKFMATPFEEPSLNLLVDLKADMLKISSFDLGNIPFIEKIGKTKIPVVMSIGGGDEVQIRASVQAINKFHNNLSILHCVSEYPCDYDRLGLGNIQLLKDLYPDNMIGLSDHFSGILSGPLAYQMGARVFEKHVTLNRSWKGTDHSFALEPDGFRKFARDIRRTPKMLNRKNSDQLGQEPVFKKLGKSLVAATDIKSGDKFSVENLSGKIFSEQFIPVRRSNELLGRIALNDIRKGESIKLSDVGLI
jgi:N-acetylneuraminate synthase/sialic acid synthase